MPASSLSLLDGALLATLLVSQGPVATPSGDTAPRLMEITVPRDEIDLAVTVLLPPGVGPHPTVVLISPSAPRATGQTLANRLVREGIAVFRYDDHGGNRSTDELGSATIQDRAEDARAVLRHARGLAETDAKRTGFVGTGSGAGVGVLAAAVPPGPSFLILVAPVNLVSRDLRLIRCPLAAVLGGNDEGIAPAEGYATLTSALGQGNRPRWSVEALPGVSRLFQGVGPEDEPPTEQVLGKLARSVTQWILADAAPN